MQITTEIFGEVLVIHTPEELTEENVSTFHDAVQSHLESGPSNVVLQMDHSDTCDSEGLTLLLDLKDEIRMSGGDLKISGLIPPYPQVFEMTRLDKAFDVFDTVVDAVTSFR